MRVTSVVPGLPILPLEEGVGAGFGSLPPPDERLPASEEHLRFLAESLPEIVWTALPNGHVDYMNRRWFEFTGLTEEETYLELKTAVHPEDIASYKEKWAASVRSGLPYEASYRFRRAADGVYRWHIGRALPVRDASGRIVKWFGTCVDVHAQKEAEEKVRRFNEELERMVMERTFALEAAQARDRANLERLRNIIGAMPIAAVATDEHLVIIQANEKFCRLFGLGDDPTSLVGRDGRELFARAKHILRHPERSLRELFQILERRQPVSDAELLLKDGRVLSRDYMPVFESGVHRGHLLLYRDVTQEKHIDRAKSDFMSLAGHQLRTPLTALRWALGRFSRHHSHGLDEDGRQLLSKARKSSATMAQTITTMLSISRIEAGLHSVSPSVISLCFFLTEIANEFQEAAQAKNITLSLRCPPRLRLRTDPVMLREILENLLGNAVKYTPEGGEITLRSYRKEEQIFVSVRDTGYGIPAHEQEKVFTKFFRGENIRQIDTHGTGLGLYLVSQLTETLGGSIRFRSAEEKGTEFVLTLPSGQEI